MVRHIPEERSHLGPWVAMRTGTGSLEVGIVFQIQNRDQLESALARPTTPYGRESFLQAHGVPDAVRARTRRWLVARGFSIVDEDDFLMGARASFDVVAKTFQLEFWETYHHGRRMFHPDRDPILPPWLEPWVLAVVGLDNVGVLHPKYRTIAKALPMPAGGYGPAAIRQAYNVPSSLDGSGVTIAILEFSNGYANEDLDAFWAQYQILHPPTVEFVSVDGTPNDGGTASEDVECTLDIEWAGAMAPGSTLVVYEASAGASDRAFGLAVLKSLRCVLNDRQHSPSVVTISYGDGESRFAAATLEAWDSTVMEMTAKGISVFIASGDQGAYGLHGLGLRVRHVDAPADCPHAIAVGGTHLVVNAEGEIAEETGWSDTNDNGASGGGVSQVFSLPAHQAALKKVPDANGLSGRGVPDVALNADPDTGYAIQFQGGSAVVGGTSVASPIWAAFCALLNQARAQQGSLPVAGLYAQLYSRAEANSGVYRDITVGNNSYYGVVGYPCAVGWDAVTGWGSPDVTQWIQSLT